MAAVTVFFRAFNQDIDEHIEDEAFLRQRFVLRARALFYARLGLLFVGLGILVVPAWKDAFQVETVRGLVVYMVMVAYSAVNYVLVERPGLGAVVTFVTLCLDLIVLVYLVVVSGSLQSPLLPTQLLFTTLFVMLFPRPLAIIPPLLTFPVVAKIQEILSEGRFGSQDLFLLIWYSVINCIIVYVLVYLNAREESKHREILRLQRSIKEYAVTEERGRLSREIHDGLGGTLSSLIIQAEYLQSIAPDESLREEIGELKASAEDSIEELRRSLTMMRDDFELEQGVQDACEKFQARTRDLVVAFRREGGDRPVSPESALAVFRVLQESLANVAKHAKASRADVTLRFDADTCTLIVADDGVGFDASKSAPPGHYGLLNMHERAQRIGGSATIESRVGAGTRVTLRVPLAGASQDGPPALAFA